MTRTKLTKLLTPTAIATAMAFTAVRDAHAVPVTGVYLEDPRCDTLPNLTLTHELGNVAFFPLNEAITYQVQPATFTVCVPPDNIQNDWLVTMTNVSGVDWQDVYFVGDLGMRIGNSDGNMMDVINAPGVVTDAFRIDSLGINANLLFESITPNNIFQNGETWTFNVSNFAGPSISPPPIMDTPGVFAGSDSIFPLPPTNTASILAIPVPEPTVVGALALVGAVLLLRRPSRAR